MKFVTAFVLLLAAGLLGWTAWISPDRQFEVEAAEEVSETPPPPPTELSITPGPEAQIVRFDVEGACCAGCVSTVHARVRDLDVVADAAVRQVGETIEVDLVLDRHADVTEMVATLSKGQYTARVADDRTP